MTTSKDQILKYPYISIQEIAQLAKVSKQTVHIWKQKNKFLQPDFTLACAPLWETKKVAQWINKNRDGRL